MLVKQHAARELLKRSDLADEAVRQRLGPLITGGIAWRTLLTHVGGACGALDGDPPDARHTPSTVLPPAEWGRL